MTALMQDQINQLRELEIPCAMLSSKTDPVEQAAVRPDYLGGAMMWGAMLIGFLAFDGRRYYTIWRRDILKIDYSTVRCSFPHVLPTQTYFLFERSRSHTGKIIDTFFQETPGGVV